MKWKLLVIIHLVTLLSFSQTMNVQKFNDDELVFTVSFSRSLLKTKDSLVQFNDLGDLTILNQTGKPALPYFTKSIQIPSQGNSILEINAKKTIRFTGVKVPLSPIKKKRQLNDSEVLNDTSFASSFYFPSNLGEISSPFLLRELRGQVVRLYPFQYDSLNKILLFHSEIFVRISFNNEKSSNETNTSLITPLTQEIGGQHFLQPSKNRLKYLSKPEKGELLIISPENYKNSCISFSNWKNQKGIRTTLVTTLETGNQASTIKSYIQNYYELHPNLLFVLLIGDNQEIPAYSYGNIDGDEYWSDSYFGQLTNDLYPELFIGRITGSNSEIEGYFQKVLNYEKNPTSGNWMNLAMGLGSNEGASIGDNNEADWQHLRVIRNNLLIEGYSFVYEFYDGSHDQEDETGNPISSKITDVINKGVGLMNYTGHGDTEIMYSGNLSSNNISKLENYGKYPFVVSVACNNGKFMDGRCIGENFISSINNNQPIGAIGFCGSSILMDWAPPMKTQDEIIRLLASPDSSYHKTTLGGLFWNGQYSMLEKYGTDGNSVIQTWIFFGDPTTELRTKETFEDNLEVLSTSDSLKIFSKINDGNYCISENNQILKTGTLVNGKCSIALKNLPYIDKKNILVTVSKQNWKPTQKLILEKNLSINAYPNPCSNKITITSIENIQSIAINTYDGKTIYSMDRFDNANLIDLTTQELNDGIYLMNCTTNSQNFTIKFQVSH